MKFNGKKAVAALLVFTLITAVAAGCRKNNNNNGEDENNDETEITLRELEPGDKYAILKVSGKIPEGYSLLSDPESPEGRLYRNGEAQIIVAAYNFIENFGTLAEFAEQASVMYALNKLPLMEHIDYKDPVNIKIAGFDAIRYEYDMTIYLWVRDADGNVVKDEDGKEVKEAVGFHKGQLNYFFSDEDAFYIAYESLSDTYDKYLPDFEEFLAGVTISG